MIAGEGLHFTYINYLKHFSGKNNYNSEQGKQNCTLASILVSVRNASGSEHAYQTLQTHVQTARELHDLNMVFAV